MDCAAGSAAPRRYRPQPQRSNGRPRLSLAIAPSPLRSAGAVQNPARARATAAHCKQTLRQRPLASQTSYFTVLSVAPSLSPVDEGRRSPLFSVEPIWQGEHCSGKLVSTLASPRPSPPGEGEASARNQHFGVTVAIAALSLYASAATGKLEPLARPEDGRRFSLSWGRAGVRAVQTTICPAVQQWTPPLKTAENWIQTVESLRLRRFRSHSPCARFLR